MDAKSTTIKAPRLLCEFAQKDVAKKALANKALAKTFVE